MRRRRQDVLDECHDRARYWLAGFAIGLVIGLALLWI